MRIAITGATGNVGTAVLAALAAKAEVESIVGVARRRPNLDLDGVHWVEADVSAGLPRSALDGADVLIHLAWAIQPSRDQAYLRRVNVDGSRAVFEAAAGAGVKALVYASSIGAYSAGPKDRLVDESWPVAGIPSSTYSRQKAEVERELDRFESKHPEVRVVRMRPGLIFRREAASEIRRLFLGPLFPGSVLRPRLIPVVPRSPRLRFQAVHALDVGEAYAAAALGEARGAFNVAADPVIDGERLARMFGARAVTVPGSALRLAAAATWRAHLQPTEPGWVDLALGSPLIDSSRARRELGWEPERTADDALAELLDGLRDAAGYPTPPLDPSSGGPGRVGEFASGIGARP